MAVIALMACADTKYHEIAYVSGLIREKGYTPLTIDISTGPQIPIRPDITRDEVLSAGGCTWEQVYALGKSEAVSRMAECAARKVYELYTKKAFDGILGMGGLQNTTVCSAALRTLPIGFPKMICSTVASGGREFDMIVGDKDITVMPSIVDFAGVNPINEVTLGNSVAALIGMMEHGKHRIDTRGEKYIGTTLMGITNDTVMRAADLLMDQGQHVISFHSTGLGGHVMENLIREGTISAVMDLCLHEMTAEYLGNYGYSKGAPYRLCAAAEMGIPALVCPGGIDFACLLKNELLEDEEERGYVWHNEILTHTRLYESEILDITRTIAARLNRSRGKTKVILPMGGLRTMSYEGEIFYKPETIQKMKKIFEQELRPEIGFQAYDMNFCDPEFADVCAAEMMKLLGGDWQA